MTCQAKIWLVRDLVTVLGTVVILLLEILGIFSVGVSCYLGQSSGGCSTSLSSPMPAWCW